jgi:Mn2+/Fe2+ NRAMP family transporter
VLSGLLGTVTIGWAIQMAWMAHKPFRRGETWAWNALAMSVSIWAALEFYYKLVEGINGVGLFAHFGLLIAFAIPLLATYRHFHPTASTHSEEEATYEMGSIS